MSAPEPESGPLQGGAIAWMARNSVAANLLMTLIIIGGLFGLLGIKQEVFPSFDLDMVMVQVVYPGASPADVEQGIVLALEEAVRPIEGVKRVTSSSAEGMGTLSAELALSADPDEVLADIKSAVDRIRTFPEDAERPIVQLASRASTVISLVISGDVDMTVLQGFAEEARAELLARPEISQVNVSGVPPLEVAVELRREALRAYGLTTDQVAMQIRMASLELPGGELETPGGEMLVRVSDRRHTAREFEDIVLRGTSSGQQITVGDVAKVTDGFADNDAASYFLGVPAVRVTALRVGDETPTAVASAASEVAEELRGRFPDGVEVIAWDDRSEILDQRIDLLARNARLGLVLVLLVLAAMLELRLAGWVALGIPISFLGAFLVLPAVDASVNMISLFAFIITLGIVVDDAIVVGENIFDKLESGMEGVEAAIAGTREMAMPVTFSVLTTVAAFAPLMFVPGIMGKIFWVIPTVVLAVLFFSLMESFFVLPAHLGHMKPQSNFVVQAISDWTRRYSGTVLQRFTQRVYLPQLRWALQHRAIVIASAVAVFLVTVGLLAGRIVPFNFFPALEGDVVTATVRMPFGTPLEATNLVRQALEKSARETIESNGGDDILRGMYTSLGSLPVSTHGPVGGGSQTGSHLLAVEVALVPLGERAFSAESFSAEWRERTPPLAGIEALSFKSLTGPGSGDAVDVLLSHRDTSTLERASSDVAEVLQGYPKLTNIDNGFASGKPQLDFSLLPMARTLGLTSQDIARQLRGAFYGSEALREQRGRFELKVMVRLPPEERMSEADLESLRIRTPSGGDVPLGLVADFERNRAPTVISREDGQRVVNVKANLKPGVASSSDVLESLRAEVFPELKARYPGLTLELVGQQRAQKESFESLRRNFAMALIAIFALLAVPFRSYVQPLIVMSAIPMGFVGAVWGHLVLGYSMSLISMFGVIALSGVVVNDSLVLIDAVNQRRDAGHSAYDAVLWGAQRRLRPIFLTSLTTFFGLLPMIFETSLQARFLIPMAISLGFGVMFSTLITLMLVPVLYSLAEQVRDWFAGADAEEPSAWEQTA